MNATPTETHPDSASARLAAYLAERKDEIINEWLNYVRNDAAIEKTLTPSALTGHIPRLFDDLIEAFSINAGDEDLGNIHRDAARHATRRWSDGYDLPDFLREIGHLRTAFIYDLKMFEEANPDFGIAARLFVSITLHRFLNEISVDGAEYYLERQKRKLMAA